jgi:branched-subunit amino acid aminotransferase/4-amino-4-deoxychorismate lyase
MLSSYLDRFFESAHGLHLKIPVDKTELRKVIMEFIKKNQLRNHGIKLILTGGYSEDGFTPIKPNLIIRAHQIKQLPAEKYRTGYKVMTCEFQRSTPEFKSLDYRHAIALIPQLLQKGLDDVLYYNNSIVTEFPRSNFFMVDQDNRLITPANNILKGITRKALLQVASEYCEVEERDIFTDELLIAREVFLTSSTKLIMPVTEIDGHPVGKGTPGPVTRRLAEMLDQLPADFEFLP